MKLNEYLIRLIYLLSSTVYQVTFYSYAQYNMLELLIVLQMFKSYYDFEVLLIWLPTSTFHFCLHSVFSQVSPELWCTGCSAMLHWAKTTWIASAGLVCEAEYWFTCNTIFFTCHISSGQCCMNTTPDSLLCLKKHACNHRWTTHLFSF